ncbi:MAG: AI-2E family transporter [Verrucomicrobia bacterium]|nr:AI-2E family transporter [Verrucomicrobiota bacterium]
MKKFELQIDQQKIIVPFLAILTLIALGAVLSVARSVVQPLIIAWLLSYIFGPLVKFMTRMRIPTSVSTALVVLIFLWICYSSGLFLYGRVSVFIGEYPNYEARLEEIMAGLAQRWNLTANPFVNVDWGKKVGASLVSASETTLAFFTNLVMVIIFLIFLLLGKPYSKYKLRKALSKDRAEFVDHILASITAQIGRYLSTLFLISLATGLCVWFVLNLIGVDFAITWGAMAFLFNFVPVVGSIIASVPPILIALVQFPNLWMAVLTGLCLLAIQMVIGNIIAPKVLGDKLNLSPVVVLLSLVFWGWLWGIVGALLSVPIASAIKIICENIEPLRPISVMMGSAKHYAQEFKDE